MTVPGDFSVSPIGAATYSIHVAAPPGTNGVVPQISLNYSSHGGNGVLGFGWSLSGLPAITRCARTLAQDGIHGAVNFNASDRFCLDGQRLLVINGGTYGADGSEYRTEIETFSKIVAHNTSGISGPGWFEVHTKSGQILELGNSTDSRILPVRVTGGTINSARTWAVDKISDTAGNYLTVTYVNDETAGQYYPDHIVYTGNDGAGVSPYNSIYFSYTARSDVTPLYHAGSVMQTTKLLSDIKTYTNPTGTGTAVSDYKLSYTLGNAPYYQLTTIKRCDGSGTNCLAPTTFGWQTAATWPTRIEVDSVVGLPAADVQIEWAPADINGDGLQDGYGLPLPGFYQCTPLYLGTGSGWTLANMTESYGDIVNQPACIQTGGVFAPNGMFFDIDSDGLSDMSAFELYPTGCFCIVRNDGAGHFAQFGASNAMVFPPANPAGQLADVDGDGRADFSGYLNTTQTLSKYSNNGDSTFTLSTATIPGDTTENAGIAGDVDGDGCADFRFQGGPTSEVLLSCNPAVATIPIPYYYIDGSHNSALYDGDFNGDGLSDYFTVPVPNGASGTLNISTGTSYITTTVPDFKSGLAATPNQYFIGDFDGDGKTDVLMIEPHDFKVYTWTSGTLALVLTVNVDLPQPVCNFLCTNQAWNGTVQLADADGNGCTDLVVWQPSNATPDYYYKFGCHPPLLMTSIDNGIGQTTSIAYSRLNSNQPFYTKCPNTPSSYACGDTYPTQAVDGPIYAVSQVDSSNGTGACVPHVPPPSSNCFTTTYAYGGAKRDLRGLGFLGYQQVTVTDHQTNVVRTTTYNTQYPLTGTVLEQKRTVGSTVLSDIINSYGTVPAVPVMGTPTFVYLAASTNSGHEVDGTALPTTTTTNANFDGYGNPQTVSIATSDGASKVTANSYANDATHWFIGQLTQTAVTSVLGSSTMLRVSSFGYDPATGILNQEIVEPTAADCDGTGTACKLETDYTLDAFGHRHISTVSGAGIVTRASSVGYDANGEFATSTTNALSQSDGWDFTGLYGASFGVPTGHTDLNAHTTNWGYDSFGRRTLQTLPGTSGPKTATSYQFCAGVNGGSASCPANGAFLVQVTPYAHDGTTQDGAMTKTYYDALSRVIATDVAGYDGPSTGCTLGAPCWIRTETRYGGNGYVAQTSRPYYLSGGTAKWMLYDYTDNDGAGDPDPYGRAWKVTNPDASQTTYVYKGLGSSGSQTNVTNALTQTTVTKKNAQNLVFSVTNAGNKTTSYAYDAFGDLLTVTDPLGNQIVNTYDRRGNKLSASDPDLGLWTYSYDALGEMTGQVDPNERDASNATVLVYDLLGRPTQRTEPDLTSAWVYDTAAHGIGAIASASGTAASYGRTHFYDTLSRPTKITLAIGGHNYIYTRAYNTDNRIDTLTYPSGLVVKYVYTQLGYLQQLKDNATGTVLWTANARDAEMHLTDATAGNGVETIQVFDPNTGLVEQIRASHDGSDDGTTANFSYVFDQIGNLKSRADNFGATENFCYDALNRLQHYSVGGSNCTTGTAGLVKSVGYDDIGNISSKSDVGTYSYPGSGPGSTRPHAVRSISGSVYGLTTAKFKYDDNGNLLCINGGGACSPAGYESVTYWSFNMANVITQGTDTDTLTYDSEHSRIVQVLANGSTSTTTTYLNDPVNGAMSEKVVSGSTTTWNDYLMADGKLVGERTTQGAAIATSYFVLDHLGSVAVVTAPDGSVPSGNRMSFDAWGKQRYENGNDDTTCSVGATSPTTRGFTGQEEMSSLCLVNLNARIYDPTIGRFLTADTVIPDPYDGQSYNRYTYVDNRPLSAVDPTGHDTDFEYDGNGSDFGGDEDSTSYWNPGSQADGSDPDAHPEMEVLGGFSISEKITTLGGVVIDREVTITYNSNGESAVDTNKSSATYAGLGNGATVTRSASDPANTAQTFAMANACGDSASGSGIETVVVTARADTVGPPHIIFIGGAGDGPHGIVGTFAHNFGLSHPDAVVRYFNWNQKGDVEDYINSLDSTASITVIGHSYGGDTGAEVAKDMPGRIDVLITVDPVGHVGNSFLTAVSQSVNVWIDVNSTGGSSFERSNIIAGLGGSYGSSPQGFSTEFMPVAVPHWDFPDMMRAVCSGAVRTGGGC